MSVPIWSCCFHLQPDIAPLPDIGNVRVDDVIEGESLSVTPTHTHSHTHTHTHTQLRPVTSLHLAHYVIRTTEDFITLVGIGMGLLTYREAYGSDTQNTIGVILRMFVMDVVIDLSVGLAIGEY